MAAFTENEIRPADTAAERERRYRHDVARLLERRSEFVPVSCPACAHGDGAARFEKDRLSYLECVRCGTVYMSPRPPEDVLRDYYADSQAYAYWNEVVFPASEGVRRERIFRPRTDQLLALCDRHGVATGTLVEVGGGFGTFCEEVRSRERFERIMVIEPTPALARTCRERGLEVIEARIEEAAPAATADVLAAFEVIEHLFDPGAFVRRCRALLAPRGLLVLTCPNVKGFDIEVLGALSPSVDAEHLNYFHPASLAHLLARNGYEVLEAATPGRLDAELVRNRVLAGEVTLGNRFLQRVLVDEWDRLGGAFQTFLADHGLSSHMWIAARAPA